MRLSDQLGKAIVALVLLFDLPAAAQLSANGASLAVTTPNAIATFAGPDLVGFRNLLTNESYLKKPTTGTLAWINMLAPTGLPFQASNWSVGTESGTGLPLATLTVQDTVRTLTLQVKVDPSSQEMVVRVSAHTSSAGLAQATWGVAGLDLTAGRLIVPADTGISFDATHPGVNTYLQYPYSWHAQMAVYETSAGSMILYSTDSQYAFKDLLTSSRGNSTLDFTLSTEAIGPYTSATSVPTVEWHFKAFAGDWKVAAQVYKDWLAANRPPVPLPANSWVHNIRTVFCIRPIDSTLLDTLSTIVTPSQTLIYLPQWRQEEYDTNYPDYTPAAGVGAFVAHAHSLGFHVMLHLDEIGVTPTNPDFAAVQAYQVRTPDTRQVFGWFWDHPTSDPQRFAWINPAASAYRSLLIARVAPAVSSVQPDAFHLDVSAPLFNDGNGLIEGMTYPQGAVQLQKDLMAAFPNVVLGGEGENDILYGYQSFAQTWGANSIPTQPGHPIASFLFGPQMQYYPNLAEPDAPDPLLKSYLNDMETRAVPPGMAINSSSDLDTTNRDNQRMFGIVQDWLTNNLQPDWTSPANGALVRYQGANNSTAVLTDTGSLTTLATSNSTLYQQAHDTSQAAAAGIIPGWPAFDSAILYGLDPTQRYWLDPSSRPTTTHVSSLPAGIQLGTRTLIAPGFAHVEVVQPASAPFDFLGSFFHAQTGVNYQAVDYPLANGAVAQNGYLTSGGVNRQAIVTHPPYTAQVGGETYVQYSLPVPANASLLFSIGMDDNDACTDGVTLRITVNGGEIFRRNINRGGWQDSSVDLEAYANTTAALRLLSNPGAQNNTGCDLSGWSNLQIASVPPPITVSVPLTLASGSLYSGFSGDGSISGTGSSAPQISNLTVPGQFTVFTRPGQSVVAGTNLASLPFEIWQSSPGQLPQPGGVFGAGTVGSATVGGVFKTPTIFAHPPGPGWATFSWVVNLPSQSGLQIGWSAGIDDNSPTADGVQFLVYVNGVENWSWTTAGHVWQAGAIDLSPWKGQNVLLQFITYSLANNVSDHAEWGDLVFSASGGQSTLPILQVSSSHTGNFTTGQPNATYSVTVHNAGANASSGLVSVTEMIPSGLYLLSMSGTGWSCKTNVCTRSDALPGGGSYPAIAVAVSVSLDAPPQVTNQVLVEGGSSLDSRASDVTTIKAFTCDLDGDALITVTDVQHILNEVLGVIASADDLNHDGTLTVADLQKEINAVVGLGCQY